MSSLGLLHVGAPNDVPCVPRTNSNYAAAVLADAPAAYWQFQDCSGFPVDTSGAGLNMTAAAYASNHYRQIGALTNATLDKSIVAPGGVGTSRPIVTAVTNGFTMECWFNPQIITQDSQEILYNGNGGANGWGFNMRLTRNFRYLAGGVAFGPNSATALTIGTWYHLAVVRNTTWTYYVNGAVDTLNAGNTNPNVPVGNTGINPGSLQRYMAHVAIYPTALTAARIAAHYAAR